ncbi:hypothetical protein MHC_03125 [Mycoplasma haemocanis str. Illinois]|uniref:Uncharacterized protein n=1 Tax=Mycoplasma haemocanis (strain Illinois) TaxID=1111676 RepID=H6N763_MYCHN|nr:hypothetical protein [Mycoplasma haemocanis]AEW45485.1 hypothetical protein MHC_03125 [Mycoplasma haemocanis str. Illinois]
MKLAGIKFLAGGVTAASATGLGIGISSIDLKERPKTLSKTKDESKVDSEVSKSTKEVEEVEEVSQASTPSSEVQPSQNGGCKVVKLDMDKKLFEEKDWSELKVGISGNEKFVQDVEKACEGTDNSKPRYQGKVYVTETGGKWNYSASYQKNWNEFKLK